MAGRKPKPTALKKLEGNPGKRKLNTKEPVPGKGMPVCPKWLRLNMWVSSTVAWIPDSVFMKGAEEIDMAALEGRDCYAGLDLSSTGDITALVLMFPPVDEDEKYVLLPYFRVPPHMIGDLEKSSFNNIEQQSLEFVKYTLDPWVCRWEQAMMRALLSPEEKRRYFFKFNVDGLLRGDYQSRMAGYATARQNGWMSANDIRELENLDMIPAEEGGDLYLINGNMVSLVDAGKWSKQYDGADAGKDMRDGAME